MAGQGAFRLLLFITIATLLMVLSFIPPSTSREVPATLQLAHPSVTPMAPPPFPAAPSPSKGIKGAYWPTWRRLIFPPSSIDSSYFTHVLYAFVQLHPSSYQLHITNDDDQDLPVFTATLHRQDPPLKALLSLGGGDTTATGTFARMAGGAPTRSAFINSSMAVARRYGLDGLDLDWEFPEDAQQMADLAQLLGEWRAAIENEALRTRRPPLLLTAAVYFASHFFVYGSPRSYPVAALRDALDFVNLMCYDYSWDTSATGAHAALYDPSGNVSTSYGVGSWLAAGMPREQVVMGLPLYGKSWRLRDPTEHGIGAPAVGTGPGDNGILTYAEVVVQNTAGGATEVYDSATVSTYSYAGTVWIGYDDPRSAAAKVEYARALDLGGYFFWALSYDRNWSISKAARDAWEN